MGNQQPSLSVRLRRLARNAKFGDGSFWKHPQCKNYKLIYTSIDLDWLKYKEGMAPEIFTSPPRLIVYNGTENRFPNAKPIYRLASITHPIFTEYKFMSKDEVLKKYTKWDFARWYLDDGSCVECRENGRVRYRVIISVGNTCSTPERLKIFQEKVLELFGGETCGRVAPNNSKATENNKSWWIPIAIAKQILSRAIRLGVMSRKFPPREWFND